jgi:proteasome lid subunit RPN8/RPN11
MLDGYLSAYHGARIRLEFARFLLISGDIGTGMDLLKECMKVSREEGFGFLEAQAGLLFGEFSEDDDSAVGVLKDVQKSASILRNTLLLARAGSILGERMCMMGEKEGVDQLMNSAGMLEEIQGKMGSSEVYLRASLNSIRLDDPRKGIEIAKEVYKKVRSTRERELLTKVLCILFFGYIKADERTKARKLLLEIVSEYPVKQFPETYAILREAVRDVAWLREDRSTSELFEEETIYKISRDAVDEIKIRAREAYPNEFGAMLRGIENITHIEPIMEGSANRSSFMFSMFSRFTQREVPGEGVVHSHPSGSARPSRADVSLFGRFPGINIIIAYPFEDDSMAAYDRMGNRVKLEIDG